MNNQVNLNEPIAKIIEQHPELLSILVELGFKPLDNKAMRNSVGKVVSLKQGTKLINVPLDKIIQELQWNGYDVKGVDEND